VRVFDIAEAAVAFLAGAGKPQDARRSQVLSAGG
jgi:hypothetical protein